MLKSQIKFRLKFFKKSFQFLPLDPQKKISRPSLEFFNKIQKVFYSHFEKKLVDKLDFLQKNNFKLFLWTKRMQFRQSGGKSIKRLKVFPQTLKTVLMKNTLSWEKASWKAPMNAVSTIASNIFWESLKSSRSNSDTSIANTQHCRHFFCQKLVIVLLNFKKKEFESFKDPTVFCSISRVDFFEAINSLIVSLEMWNAVFKTFRRAFAEIPGLLAEIPKIVMSLDFIPKKTLMILGKNRMQFSKKMEVILSRIKKFFVLSLQSSKLLPEWTLFKNSHQNIHQN